MQESVFLAFFKYNYLCFILI